MNICKIFVKIVPSNSNSIFGGNNTLTPNPFIQGNMSASKQSKQVVDEDAEMVTSPLQQPKAGIMPPTTTGAANIFGGLSNTANTNTSNIFTALGNNIPTSMNTMQSGNIFGSNTNTQSSTNIGGPNIFGSSGVPSNNNVFGNINTTQSKI
jgi:hypothetical protein